MNEIKALHRQAMAVTDEAILARQRADDVAAVRLFREAFELERTAAMALVQVFEAEPNRSILFRSAATLALDAHLPEEAERLVCYALIGNPPASIAEELRDLLEQVHFERHLSLRGIELLSDEVQFSLSGNSVGYGMAPTDLVIDKIDKAQKLLLRTTERRVNRPFRERGRPSKDVSESVGLFMSVPRAASFAVTFRIGRPDQLALPGLSVGGEVIDEIITCLELFASNELESLHERIPDQAYFQNFLGLAEAIAPDGREISQVGFTATVEGKERRVALTSRDALPPVVPTPAPADDSERSIEVIGTLKAADASSKKNTIKLVEQGRATHTILVPEGMMADIVRPLWDSKVKVVGLQKGNQIHLRHITSAE